MTIASVRVLRIQVRNIHIQVRIRRFAPWKLYSSIIRGATVPYQPDEVYRDPSMVLCLSQASGFWFSWDDYKQNEFKLSAPVSAKLGEGLLLHASIDPLAVQFTYPRNDISTPRNESELELELTDMVHACIDMTRTVL